jgi:hypothetical protein
MASRWTLVSTGAGGFGCLLGEGLIQARRSPGLFSLMTPSIRRTSLISRPLAHEETRSPAIRSSRLLKNGGNAVIGEGPAGMVYYHPGRLMDGIIDPRWPEALIYKPAKPGRNRRPTLVGVETRHAVLSLGKGEAAPLPRRQVPTPRRVRHPRLGLAPQPQGAARGIESSHVVRSSITAGTAPDSGPRRVRRVLRAPRPLSGAAHPQTLALRPGASIDGRALGHTITQRRRCA